MTRSVSLNTGYFVRVRPPIKSCSSITNILTYYNDHSDESEPSHHCFTGVERCSLNACWHIISTYMYKRDTFVCLCRYIWVKYMYIFWPLGGAVSLGKGNKHWLEQSLWGKFECRNWMWNISQSTVFLTCSDQEVQDVQTLVIKTLQTFSRPEK